MEKKKGWEIYVKGCEWNTVVPGNRKRWYVESRMAIGRMKFYLVVVVECAMVEGLALCSASRRMVKKCIVGRENEE